MVNATDFLAQLFERTGISYAVIGGHAVNVWLEPRFTADIDVTIVASRNDLANLLSECESAGLRLERQYGEEQPSGPDFIRLVDEERSVVLELQTSKTEFQRELVERAVLSPSGLRVATAEDLIVLKTIAYRAKDEIDLIGLTKLPSIDWDYVEARCRDWDVLERLRDIRSKQA